MIFSKKDWKSKLDPVLKDYLNSLLSEVKNFSDSYMSSADPKTAQLWVAIALLYRKLSILESKLSSLEKKLNNTENDLDSLKKL